MHYKNIYIRDFGIFNNQHLTDLSDKLVVIGGKNRAGKSTFLKLLRYFPYGLPQDKSIPPAADKYYIEAELEKENKNYQLSLEGFSKPRVLDAENKVYSASELFNQLDQLSYQHLFSISLNELQHLSKIAKGKKKEKRLYSILLGAGFSELVKVPELADKYLNNAVNTGGKLGDPSVAAFKPYYNQIKEAEENRDQALLEVKEFSQKREELEKKQNVLQRKKEIIAELENRDILIDLLKNNYNELEEIENLQKNLKRAVMDNSPAVDFVQTDSDYSEDEVNDQNKLKKLVEFLAQDKSIKNFQQKEEAVKERISNYQFQEEKINNIKKKLIFELENLDFSWQGGLAQLERIELDLIKEQKLNLKLKEFENLNSEIEKIESDIVELRDERDDINLELEGLKYKKPEKVLRLSYSILFFSFFTLATSFFINLNQIRYLSLILALTAFIYYSSSYKSSRLEKSNAEKLKKEKELKEKELAELKLDLEEKKNLLDQSKSDLDDYARILGIEAAEYQSFIASYFREIRDIKRRYQELKVDEAAHLSNEKELIKILQDLKALINETAEHSSLDFYTNKKTDLIKDHQILFKDFKLIKDIKKLADDYLIKISQLKYTLKASDKIKKALQKANNEQSYYLSFKNFYQEYLNLTAVEEEKENLSRRLSDLKEEKEKLEEAITTLKNRIKSLSTSTKIESALQKIDLARTKLEKRAQNYALNQSVAFILKKLRSRMIAKAEKELLKPASKILSRISSNHYSRLKTASDLDQNDFRIVTKKGRNSKSTKELSQGSLEQLFLSVRLSRIKEINPPLPLVLDDSLVNFDRSHLYNTAELLAELADSHQIFILSCHPHLVSFISEISSSAQYWKLESGSFRLTQAQELITHLS